MTIDAAIRALLVGDPAQSDRSISVQAGCSPGRVARRRAELEAEGIVAPAIVRVGADGRRRAVRGLGPAALAVLTDREQRDAIKTVIEAARAGDLDAALWVLEADRRWRAS